MCDHFVGVGGMSNDELYMTVSEQKDAMTQAGFQSIQELMVKGTMALHHAS